MDWLQLSKIWGRNLDRVPGYRKDHNVLPRMQLVLVLDHLRPLPVILNTSALQRELLNLHRDRPSSLSLDDSNIILGFGTIHVNHPWLSNNSSNNNILWLPVLCTVWCGGLSCIILDHVFTFSNDYLSVWNIEEQGQRSWSLLDEARGLLRIPDIDPVDLQQDVSQLDTSTPS